ncbi:hypothetical protein J4G08_09935 [Candidatus Poribacteria bacterium]|nr:hypothetical protein [Candidatus Poribacteria bacterium]
MKNREDVGGFPINRTTREIKRFYLRYLFPSLETTDPTSFTLSAIILHPVKQMQIQIDKN